MSITPVTTKSNSYTSPLGDNDVIKLLERQKMQLQEQIQKINESKQDIKTKQERVKQIEDQIQQVDMEIQQKRNEKLNQNQKSNNETVSKQSNAGNSGDSNDYAEMSSLLQASTTYSQAKIMNNTKNSLIGKSNVLEIEIKLDEGRGGNAKTKKAELQETKSKIQKLDEKVGETLQTSQKQVKKASKVEIKNNETNNRGKDGEIDDTQKFAANSNTDIRDTMSVNNGEQENAQAQEVRRIDRNHKKIDIRV